jgi:hypothetical protein
VQFGSLRLLMSLARRRLPLARLAHRHVVATSVPLVLAVVVLVMNMLGMDLNRITLGTLIIALGPTTAERRDEQLVTHEIDDRRTGRCRDQMQLQSPFSRSGASMPFGGPALQTPIFCKT